MSVSNVNTVVIVPNHNEKNTTEQRSIDTAQLREIFEQQSGNSVIAIGNCDEDTSNKSTMVPVKPMATKETVIDIEIIRTKAIPNNIMYYPRVMLKNFSKRYPYRKHQQNPYPGPYPPPQGYPPQGYPPQGYPPQGYPPQGYPPPGYPPPGYPPQGYPPPGYPPPGYPPPMRPPNAGGFQNFSGGPDNDEPEPYDPETRNAFIRLVMMIVLVMLIATAIIVCFSITVPEIRNAFRRAGILIILPVIGLMMCNYAMMCSPCSQRPPFSFVVLFLTTMFMSLLASIISCRYRTQIVAYAVIATAGVVFVCVILACSTFDFTKFFLYVIVIGVGLSLVGVMLLLGMLIGGVYMKPLHIGILVLMVIFQSVVLIMEIQMIIGGKTIQLEDDQYAMAAFMLYTSIVEIFIKLLQIMGLLDS